MARLISSGVLVTDGERLLLGHASGSRRWDIPKGLVDPGEDLRAAAVRELQEETGLAAPAAALIDLGVHRYLSAKDLALFRWVVAAMPELATLHCASTYAAPDGRILPEFDRFAVVPLRDVRPLLGKSLAALLDRLGCFTAAG